MRYKTNLFRHTQTSSGSTRVAASSREVDEKIRAELKACGLGFLGLRSGAVRLLTTLLEKDETIGGAVYGRSATGPVLLVATDRRVVLVDKKPLFSRSEDITYDNVTGQTLEWVGPSGTFILQTHSEDIKVHTNNKLSAVTFQRFLEHRAIEHERTGVS